jgi:hypothetical protein
MIRIPYAVSESLPFRWFVEFVIDNSPLFRTTSAIAKAATILNADLDTPGKLVDLNSKALELLRSALTSEEYPLETPLLEVLQEGGAPAKVPPRILSGYITAILEDAEAIDLPATESAPDEPRQSA